MNASAQLTIAIIQTHLAWENPTKNRNHFYEKIKLISNQVDLIVLPEMFTTGFTMNAENLAENTNGETTLWMQKVAKEKNAAITGSLLTKENNCFYNRLLFVHPNGKINTYDKRHLFTLGGENKQFSYGKKQVCISYKNWKICPLICYDLRFPVWSRNTNNYDLLLYVANWPKPRITAWNTLLKARAIENMSFTIGANRIGTDNNNLQYTGNSAVYNYLGNMLCKSENDTILTVTLHKKEQNIARKKYQFLNDQDSFTIKTDNE